MYCPACGTNVDSANFCPKCGKPTSNSQASSNGGAAVAMAPAPAAPQTKSKSRAGWVLIVLLLGVLWLFVSNAPKDNPTANALRQVATHPLSTPVSNQLFATPVTLSPLQYRYTQIDLPASAHDIHVDGRFEARGGFGNDVEVFVFDADGFENWKNHHNSRTYYNSGKVTAGTVSARLPDTTEPTAYFMVMSNTFSVVSNKVVQAQITLNYQR